jgi:hypothetical protein
MPESFTCQVSMTRSTTTIECEPEASDPQSPGTDLTCRPPEPESRSKSTNPAVDSLVSRFSSDSARTAPPKPPSARETPGATDLALHCSSELAAVAIALIGATRAHPLIGVLAAAKTGLDLAKCISREQHEGLARASHESAVAECETNGGTPLGVVNDQLICGIPPRDAR